MYKSARCACVLAVLHAAGRHPGSLPVQNGQYCPLTQPPQSAYREASFGHGILEFSSPTEATWEWHRCTIAPAAC